MAVNLTAKLHNWRLMIPQNPLTVICCAVRESMHFHTIIIPERRSNRATKRFTGHEVCY